MLKIDSIQKKAIGLFNKEGNEFRVKCFVGKTSPHQDTITDFSQLFQKLKDIDNVFNPDLITITVFANGNKRSLKKFSIPEESSVNNTFNNNINPSFNGFNGLGLGNFKSTEEFLGKIEEITTKKAMDVLKEKDNQDVRKELEELKIYATDLENQNDALIKANEEHASTEKLLYTLSNVCKNIGMQKIGNHIENYLGIPPSKALPAHKDSSGIDENGSVDEKRLDIINAIADYLNETDDNTLSAIYTICSDIQGDKKNALHIYLIQCIKNYKDQISAEQ